MPEVRKLPTVEFEGKEWTFDQRLSELRHVDRDKPSIEFLPIEDMEVKVGGYTGKERILQARIRGKMRLLPLKEVL